MKNTLSLNIYLSEKYPPTPLSMWNMLIIFHVCFSTKYLYSWNFNNTFDLCFTCDKHKNIRKIIYEKGEIFGLSREGICIRPHTYKCTNFKISSEVGWLIFGNNILFCLPLMHPLHNNKFAKLRYIILINTISFVMKIFMELTLRWQAYNVILMFFEVWNKVTTVQLRNY